MDGRSVITTHIAKPAVVPGAQVKPSVGELTPFFRGTGMDSECRTLEQILQWEDALLEVCHDYIQWLLPTDEASRFNSDAPILTEEVQALFLTDEPIRQNLRRALGRFLRFLGLEFTVGHEAHGGGRLRLDKAKNFERRLTMCWRGPANHNWMRLSRALRCLRLVALEEERHALKCFLERLIVEYPGMIHEESIQHWAIESGVRKLPEVAARQSRGTSGDCCLRCCSPASTVASSTELTLSPRSSSH